MQGWSKRTVKMHYTSVLAKLQKYIANKWPQLHRAGWRLHHDNAQPHVANYVMQFLAKFNITALHPNLAPCDFFLFPSLNTKLQGIRFDISEAVLKESEAILKDLTKNGLHLVFEEWQQRCKKCIQLGGVLWKRPCKHWAWAIKYLWKKNQSQSLLISLSIIPYASNPTLREAICRVVCHTDVCLCYCVLVCFKIK